MISSDKGWEDCEARDLRIGDIYFVTDPPTARDGKYYRVCKIEESADDYRLIVEVMHPVISDDPLSTQ